MKYFFDNFDERYISMQIMQDNMPELAEIYGKMTPEMRESFVKSNEFKAFFETKNTCETCKGKCCNDSPCEYSSNDFDFSEKFAFDKLREQIDMGKMSLVTPKPSIWNYNASPKFRLVSRAEGGSAVEIGNVNKKCSLITSKGCPLKYDERPTGAVLLGARADHNCIGNILNGEYEAAQWQSESRQAVLRKLVDSFYGNENFEKAYNEASEKASRGSRFF